MKRMIAFVLSAVIALSLVACGGTKITGDNNPVEIPNPFTECKTMEEASKLAGFDMTVPDSVEGKEKIAIRVDADGKLIEVIYGSDEEKIVIRKAKGTEDISGDYNVYDESNNISVGNLQVVMKGNNDQVSLATWTNNDYSYSIGFYYETDISDTAMSALIDVVQ